MFQLFLVAKRINKSWVYSLFHINIYPQSKSFCFTATTQNIKTCNIPLKSPIKWLPKMQKKFWIFNFCLVLGPFSKKLCFWKMVVLGIKQGPRPPILHSFFMKLDEEGLLKISLKNFHSFQSYPFFKNAIFSKMALKI